MIVSHAKNICVIAHECKRGVRPGWHTGRVTTVGTTTVGTAADSADSPVRGPLRPIELATGAVLGAVSVTLVVIAAVVPFAAALQLLAAVPFGVLAHRHRIRAVVAATVATLAVGFVAGGTSVVMSLMSCAVLGGIVGHVKRRRRGLGLMLLYSTVAALASAAFAVGLLLVFTNTRILFFDTVRDTARGMSDRRRAPARPRTRGAVVRRRRHQRRGLVVGLDRRVRDRRRIHRSGRRVVRPGHRARPPRRSPRRRPSRRPRPTPARSRRYRSVCATSPTATPAPAATRCPG